MSDQSNNQGRAYEYVCLTTLSEEINKIRYPSTLTNKFTKGLIIFFKS